MSKIIPVPTRRDASLRNNCLEIFIGVKIATKPRIIPRLKILDPSTFPTDIACWSLKAADIETANSGADVAMATIVSPITRSERPNLRAIFEAETTTQVAPPQSPKAEMTNISISKKIEYPQF